MSVFFIATVIAAITTFSFVYLFKTGLEKHSLVICAHKIHHSVFGAFLFVVGLASGKMLIAATGLGIYLAHVTEEICFNKVSFIEALSVFVTRK